MIDMYNELLNTYRSMRHYQDEYKAFQYDSYIKFALLLNDACGLLYKNNMETGNVTIPEGHNAKDYEDMILKLKAAQSEMIPLHDPNTDKIPLWNGKNMPWDLVKSDEWDKLSHDGSDFFPHLIPFIHDDGKKRPAVLISGGSYRIHFYEGFPFAEWYYKNGYNAFVLNNRHGVGAVVRKSMNRALDLQRAIRTLRARANEFCIDENRIFTNGCSMGNRATIDLINSLGVNTPPEKIDCSYLPDEIDKNSARLNAYVSIYPALFTWDNHINYRDFPPTFFVLGNKDWSLWRMMPFMSDLIVNDVRVELHLFDGVGHGFALGKRTDVNFANGEYTPAVQQWTSLLTMWLDNVLGKAE